LTLQPDGSFTYAPTAGFSGADQFTYEPNDGTVDGNMTTVTLNVAAFNTPPVGVADSYSATAGSTLTVAPAQGVLANDTDAEGDTLTAVLVDGPTHGNLTLSADGSFLYTAAAGFHGVDTFTYKPNDGTADGNSVTVNLNVVAVNTPPVGVADQYVTPVGGTLSVPFATGVLANDTDADGNTLTAILVNAPAHGVLTLHPDGSFTYTAAA